MIAVSKFSKLINTFSVYLLQHFFKNIAFPVIVTECEFIQISMHMFLADVSMGAQD